MDIQDVPAKVLEDVVAVNCNGAGTMAVKTDGTLWMWGTGVLPGNDRESPLDPVKIMDGVALPGESRP